MATSNLNSNPEITKKILSLGLISNDPFILFDIGASQGIESHWKIFQPFFKAYGFDPLVKEMHRLNNLETNPNIKYFDAFITSNDIKENLSRYWFPNSYQRSTAMYAGEIINKPYKLNFNNNDSDMIESNNKFSIDDFCINNHDINNIDFIKIDTDGHDLDVINGSLKSLKDKNVLGLFVECQFQGPLSDDSNSFYNIDKVLRNNGFSLFDLETYRYSKKALPDNFYYDIFAQTKNGQVLAGDALYIRDYMAEGYSNKFCTLSNDKLLKLICIFEIYGLYDCAAEIIIYLNKNNCLNNMVTKDFLDILTKKYHKDIASYDELIRLFNNNPQKFFPHNEIIQKLNKIELIKKIYKLMRSFFFKK